MTQEGLCNETPTQTCSSALERLHWLLVLTPLARELLDPPVGGMYPAQQFTSALRAVLIRFLPLFTHLLRLFIILITV